MPAPHNLLGETAACVVKVGAAAWQGQRSVLYKTYYKIVVAALRVVARLSTSMGGHVR
jgi:hypothetical protein